MTSTTHLAAGRHNAVKTAALMGVLSAIIIGIGSFWGRTGVTFALLIAVGTNAYAYWNSDKMALRSMRAQPVSEVEQPAMYRIVRELSTQSRQPMPRLYISHTDAPTPSRPAATPSTRRCAAPPGSWTC